uniref:Dynein light chain n=1 Tax=Acrobeloides nanus TaxID=290746 RepID=A0A914DUE0_9BILA
MVNQFDNTPEKREEEESEPKFTEDYLRASIEYKDITEDKLSNITKWATEIKQNAKSELMCVEIRNKLENKYGDYWNCFFGKIHDYGYRYTDSYVRFKFKEMNDKRLIIYRCKF